MAINADAHTVALRINVLTFRPLGNLLPTTVRMAIELFPAPPTGHVPVVTLDGSYHIIIGPRRAGNGVDMQPDMNLAFRLPLNAFRFIGVSFVGRNAAADDLSGQITFPEVRIEPNGADHELTIRNMRRRGPGIPASPAPPAPPSRTSFDYAIIIHNLETNELGIIDPEIENEH